MSPRHKPMSLNSLFERADNSLYDWRLSARLFIYLSKATSKALIFANTANTAVILYDGSD